MPYPEPLPHIYQRAVSGDSQDSLSIIASLIEPGQTLLDLGMGTGGLGQYLSQRQALVADGVTLNQAEADTAAAWYRQVAVADLDHADLCQIFAGQQYDCIVCADVLEHLKAPENVLVQCKALLKPGGRLITSVPNAGYCGLIAELIQGEFRYRPEGLLDNTHLRFFTRASLQRFLGEQGWHAVSFQTTCRNLLASEFKVAFDSLPPAVARHLLALPDAQSYQFVSVWQPITSLDESSGAIDQTLQVADPLPASALFSAQLFLAKSGGYREDAKLVTAGAIGKVRQLLHFQIPASAESYTAIRFDPADRPGFFTLHHLRLELTNGAQVWQWQAGQDDVGLLSRSAQQQILFQTPWVLSEGVQLFLYGDDPQLELPIAPETLQQVAEQGARLEVCAGWPMSADYAVASASASQAIGALQTANRTLTDRHNDDYQQIAVELDHLHNANLALLSKLASVEDILDAVRAEKQTVKSELNVARRNVQTLQEQLSQSQRYLWTINNSNLYKATRPIVSLKMKLDRMRKKSPLATTAYPLPSQHLNLALPTHPVDIIVPVYRGIADTRCCIESVLNATCQTAWRLIVINDCSPEPELCSWLRELAQREPRVVLLENSENLGFVATVNKGMELSSENDVLLLNSDAEVANDWLDRIQCAAYSQPHVASVTPFSNNATICSYPRFCQPNELPAGIDTAQLDQLFATHLAGQTVPIPTAIGFCMYIRRQCLQDVGLFDVKNFGKGYGEENDFCVRAQQAGWVNLHALDTFVRHAGGVSFGDSKSTRELQAMQTIRRLHPEYESDVHAFVQSDPARQARLCIDIARITTSQRPVVLNISHNREGGTLRHVREMAQQLGAQATFLRLTPVAGGADLQLEGPHEAFVLHFSLPGEHARLLHTLRQLQVGHIHYHHLLGHTPDIVDLPVELGVTHDFTAHDYYSYCPQVSLTDHTDRYCGEQGLEQCYRCLQRNPAPGGEGIESWRARHARLLNQARYVITPSLDTAQRVLRFVPAACIRVAPHSMLSVNPALNPAPRPRLLSPGQPLKIVVLGAISKIKGADTLEAVAMLAAKHNKLVEFHLLGYAYRSLCTQPKARLTVHGGYEEKDLPLLLEWLQPDAVWFPAQCPETYSYTLSAGLEAGLPIIAPNIGAFAERLQHRDWTWLCDWQQSAGQWIEFFSHIRQQHFCTAMGPSATRMAEQSLRIDGQPLAYDSSYLQSLPVPSVPDADQLKELQQQIALHIKPTGIAIRSVTLQTLMRLRASRALSPIVRVVPMYLQRRFKSWLQS